MATRQLGEYTLVSKAIPTDPVSNFYRPGVLVLKEGHFEGPTYLLEHLDAAELSEDEAYRRANEYIVTARSVTKNGLVWDRPA